MAYRKSIFELNRIDKNDVRNSTAWFDEQIKKLGKARTAPNQVMTSNVSQLKTNIIPGRPMFFYYDPKHKDTLPYYDTFPLVLPFAKTKEGFTGLNLHYLDYKPRLMLFKELDKIFAKSTTPMAKIQMSWDLVRGVSKLSAAAPCIKQYLFSHVESMFFEIPRDDWYTAVMLPVQRFVGASNQRVWSESKRKMGW